MEDDDLLYVINKGLRRKYSHEHVFSEQIDLKILKKIDKQLFNKGLAFYMDPAPIVATESMSVFFQ